MSEREELEAEIAAIEQAWLFSEDAGDTAGRRRHLATALISSGYTKGNGELVEAVRRAIDCMEHIAGPEFDWDEGAADAVTVGMIVQRDCSRLSQRLRKALSDREEAGPSGDGWQPIETAPKDGTWCLLWSAHLDARPPVSVRQYRRWSPGGGDSEMLWVDHLACVSPSLIFTHWMPLPAPPVLQELHGDGVRDDTEVVQERVNAGLTIGDSHDEG